MSRNQRSREMVSAHASGRNDDTLWCVARPRVQWQLDWARCPNSSPLLCCSSWQPPLTEKHDSNPLIQTPECHSEINRQIIHQWDTVLLFCPLYDKDGVFFPAIQGLWRNINHTIIITKQLKYGCFFYLTSVARIPSNVHHIILVFCNRWTHCSKCFRHLQWFTRQLQTCQSKNTLRIILC